MQAAQAVAVAATDHVAGDYLVKGAVALILGLQGYLIRSVSNARGDIAIITQALFGRRGDNGIEHTVEEHSAELVDHGQRITDTEGRLDRIDPDQRTGPPNRRRARE